METLLHAVRSSLQDLCLCLSGFVLSCLLAVSVLRECRRFLRAHPWHVFLVLSVSSIYATVEARKPNGEDSEQAPARRQVAMVMRTDDGDLLPPVNGTAEPGLVIATLESTASNLTFVATWPNAVRMDGWAVLLSGGSHSVGGLEMDGRAFRKWGASLLRHLRSSLLPQVGILRLRS